MADNEGEIKAKREAAERARRLSVAVTLQVDRDRILAFAADLEDQADALERALGARNPAAGVTQTQMQVQQGPPSKDDDKSPGEK